MTYKIYLKNGSLWAREKTVTVPDVEELLDLLEPRFIELDDGVLVPTENISYIAPCGQ